MKRSVSEDLCEERSSNIEGKVDKIIDKVDHMKGNCLTTIKGQLTTLETHHGYNQIGMKEIKDSVNELRELIIKERNTGQSKEKPKVDKDVVMGILKVATIMGLIMYLVISGNIGKGVDIGVDIGKGFLTTLIGG